MKNKNILNQYYSDFKCDREKEIAYQLTLERDLQTLESNVNAKSEISIHHTKTSMLKTYLTAFLKDVKVKTKPQDLLKFKKILNDNLKFNNCINLAIADFKKILN